MQEGERRYVQSRLNFFDGVGVGYAHEGVSCHFHHFGERTSKIQDKIATNSTNHKTKYQIISSESR